MTPTFSTIITTLAKQRCSQNWFFMYPEVYIQHFLEKSKSLQFSSDFAQIIYKAVKTAFYCPEKHFGKTFKRYLNFLFFQTLNENFSTVAKKIRVGCQNCTLAVQKNLRIFRQKIINFRFFPNSSKKNSKLAKNIWQRGQNFILGVQ